MGGKTEGNLLKTSKLRQQDRESKKEKTRGGKEGEMVIFL